MKTIRHLFKNSLLLLLPLLFGVSVVQGQTTVTIGTGTTVSTTTTNGNPIYRSGTTSSYHHSKSVQLLTAAQMSTAGIPVGALINNIGYNKTTNGTPSGANAFVLNVYLKNSSATTLASGTAWSTMISGATLAYTQTITSANMPSATGYWMWPCSGFTYTGGALEVYIEWYPTGTMTSPFSTNSFLWQYTTSGNQSMGMSSTTAIAGTNTSYNIQARFYNTSITYTPAVGCSGAPTGGTTQANGTSTTLGACLTSSVGLSVTGGTAASGLTYQWQYSASGSGYTDISGATSSGYSIASLTAGNIGYYQRVETCTASGQATPSTPVQVTQNNFLTCYCIPSFSSPTTDEDIKNVTFGTLNNTSACAAVAPGAGSVAGSYSNYKSGTGAPAAPDVSMGSATSFSVNVGFCNTGTFSNGIAIWIDTDHSGTFDAGERYYSSTAILTTDVANGVAGATQTVSGGRTESGTITIPVTALTGLTAMRVMASETGVPSAACTTPSGYGEAEDYMINILCPTPTALVATAITSSSATLGWTSSSTSFDIEYGANGFSQGTGTTATSATNSLAISGLSPSTSYDFFVRTNCGSGNYSSWAGPYTFLSGSATDGGVSGIVVTDMCSGTSDVTVLLSNLGLNTINAGDASLELQVNGMSAGAPVSNSTNLDIIGGGNPTTETITFTNVNLTPAGSFIFTVTATITGDGNTANDVTNATQTIGIVSAGTATTTASGAICPSVTFDLGLTGAGASSNTVYQWEKSTDNGSTWSNVAGGATATVTALTQSATTLYHCVLTCGSTTLTSSDITVTTNPFYNCYCTAGLTSSGAAGDIVTNVTFGTLVQASGGASPYYTNYASTQNAIPNLSQGSSSNILITMGTDGTQHSMVWVDFNQNGTFDASEAFLGASVGASGTATISIVVPSGIPAGLTKMRVRGASDGAYTAAGACSSTTYGETEDYLVNIVCPTPTALTATAITATGATLGWTSSSSNFDIEYGATGFTQTTGTTTTSTTNSKAITGLTASTGYEFYVRTNCGSGSYSSWAGPYPFTTGDPLDIAISAVTVVDKCAANGTSDVTVLVSNVGTTDVNTGDVSLDLTLDGNLVGNTSNTATIIGGGTETVTFTNVNLGAAASMVFNVTATTTGDANTANDVASTTQLIGIVSAGTATTTASGAICPSVTFDLGLTGAGASSNTVYQWEKSTDNGSTWSNVAGGATATVTALTQSVTTLYHCVLTCGSTTLTSSDVTVTSSPYYNCYCTAAATSTSFEKISNVTIGTINNASTSTAGYEDFTAQSTNLILGSSNSLTVTISGGYSADMALVWIDLNQNGSFTDAGENVYTSAQGVGPHTGTITIPTSALTGVTRMRIRMSDTSTGHNATPCGTSTYGQVEDYLVNIVCPTPTALTATSITATGATLGWTSNLSSFDVEYGATGFTQGTGIATTSVTTSKAITGLTIGTSYDFYVRTNCSSNSTWAGPYTFATACTPNSSVTIPTTADTTVYATHSCLDATGWTYFYNGNTLLLGVEMGSTWNPGALVQTTPGSGQYRVRVDVGASMVANLTSAPYNDSTNGGYGSGKPWQVVNRTWDLELNNVNQEPVDSVNIKTYFTEAEYQAVNGTLTQPGEALQSPSQMTIYKLRAVSAPLANPAIYENSMQALDSLHSLLDSAHIRFYNNQSPYLPHWQYAANTPSTGVHQAIMKIGEFSGGGGGGGAGGSSPFAVELAYLNGHNQGASNLLNWATISEMSNKAFEVQRSENGTNYQTIGRVNSKAPNGTSSATLSYEFVDMKPAKTSYYRLKQIDIDGRTNILPQVVEISLADNFKTAINLFPNPATSELNVAITGSTQDTYNVEVSDIYGRKVASAQQVSNGGTNISTINVSNLVQGTYIVTVKDRTNNIVSTQRFVKE